MAKRVGLVVVDNPAHAHTDSVTLASHQQDGNGEDHPLVGLEIGLATGERDSDCDLAETRLTRHHDRAACLLLQLLCAQRVYIPITLFWLETGRFFVAGFLSYRVLALSLMLFWNGSVACRTFLAQTLSSVLSVSRQRAALTFLTRATGVMELIFTCMDVLLALGMRSLLFTEPHGQCVRLADRSLLPNSFDCSP